MVANIDKYSHSDKYAFVIPMYGTQSLGLYIASFFKVVGLYETIISSPNLVMLN